MFRSPAVFPASDGKSKVKCLKKSASKVEERKNVSVSVLLSRIPKNPSNSETKCEQQQLICGGYLKRPSSRYIGLIKHSCLLVVAVVILQLIDSAAANSELWGNIFKIKQPK